MRSLVFLVIRSFKNSLLELLRKPGKLILWILVAAMVIGFFLLSVFTSQSSGGVHNLVWLKGILFGMILIFTLISLRNALSNGSVIFDMSDVNLLFVSPVSPRMILLYGIVRMTKMAFAASFFILFQGSSLGNGFGIAYGGVLLILLGFILAVCLLQILSLLIYSTTNGRNGRKLAVKLIAAAVFLPLAVYLCFQFIKTGASLNALQNALQSPFLSFTPVVGWASAGIVALISGDMGTGILYLGLIVGSGALLLLYIALSNPDYYEDVLVATETAFEKKRTVAEGQMNTEATSSKKVRVAQTGIGGQGASALFYKHLRESFRANRLGLWGTPAILVTLGAALMALFLRDGGMLMILQILMWMQIFLIGTGRGLKEFYLHYIYLIPESSFSKIVWSNLEFTIKVLGESVVIFSITGAIMGQPASLIALSVVVYTLFSFLLLGINYLSLRWTGTDISAGLMIFIYTIAVILIMLPGLAAAIIVGSMLGEAGLFVGLGILALWELIAALGCFAMSGGILHRCDIPVVKMGQQQ